MHMFLDHLGISGAAVSIKNIGEDKTKFCPGILNSVYATEERKPCGRFINPWWRHQMETFSASLVICAAGNSPVTGEFPAQRPLIFSSW